MLLVLVLCASVKERVGVTRWTNMTVPANGEPREPHVPARLGCAFAPPTDLLRSDSAVEPRTVLRVDPRDRDVELR